MHTIAGVWLNTLVGLLQTAGGLVAIGGEFGLTKWGGMIENSRGSDCPQFEGVTGHGVGVIACTQRGVLIGYNAILWLQTAGECGSTRQGSVVEHGLS